jgi:hypothetical protein
VEKGGYVATAKGMRREDFSPQQLRDYGDYCDTDAEICQFIYDKQIVELLDEDREMLHLTMRKALVPQLVLDLPLLENALYTERTRKETILKALGGDDAKKMLMSNNKFAELLMALGVSPPMKISVTTGKEAFAFAKTDQGMKDLLDHHNVKVRVVTSARLGVKSTIEETRLQRFINVAKTSDDHNLPFPLLYFGAHTGRLSGYDKLNLQNLTRGSALRDAIRAPEGYSLVVGDLSQIEARVLAWWAGQKDLLEAFAAGRDVYCEFASRLYKHTITKADSKERFVGKTAILGLGFQCGPDRFRDMVRQANVEMDHTEAENTVRMYRGSYSKIVDLWAMGEAIIVGMFDSQMQKVSKCTVLKERVVLPSGRILYYPEMYRDDMDVGYKAGRGHFTKLYGGKFIENAVQAMAQVIIRDMEIALTEMCAGLGIYAAGQVHDELIYVVPDAVAPKMKRMLEHVMTTPPEWAPDLPVACEVKIGKTYAETK